MNKHLTTLSALAGLVLVAPMTASATTPPASPILQVSELHQLVNDVPTPGTYHGGSDPRNREWESDNFIAVDPTHPNRLAMVYLQDWQEAVIAAYSDDGGHSWERSVLKTGSWTWGYHGEDPPVRDGNDFARTNSPNNPAVAIGPARNPAAPGVVYATSVVIESDPVFATSAMLVNVSTDGGRTWSDPAVIDTASQEFVLGQPISGTGTHIDQTYVAADPDQPGVAYVLWMKGRQDGSEQHVYVSRTHNSGADWSEPVQVSTRVLGESNFAPQLAILPDGRLLATYLALPAQPLLPFVTGTVMGPARWYARVSEDRGDSWLPPGLIGQDEVAQVARLAVGPDGTAVVSWLDIDQDAGAMTVEYRTSKDYTTWAGGSAGDPIGSEPQTGSWGVPTVPAVAVSSRGEIGIAFYDHCHDKPETAAHESGYWLRTSTDGGATWQERLVAGPFDASTAPSWNGKRNGDEGYTVGTMGAFQGMATDGLDFVLSFVLGDDLPGANFELDGTWPNGTDVYFSRVRPRPAVRADQPARCLG
jgi:hypothetical protein